MVLGLEQPEQRAQIIERNHSMGERARRSWMASGPWE